VLRVLRACGLRLWRTTAHCGQRPASDNFAPYPYKPTELLVLVFAGVWVSAFGSPSGCPQ
jgi:hypothetical protein